MKLDEIKIVATARPFKPFEIHLDNGEIHLVTHPEIIITQSIIAAVNQDGKLILIAPEAVSSIRILDEPKI